MTTSTATYLLPIRRADRSALAELTAYLAWVAERAQLIVVDGSPADIFAEHHEAWKGFAEHVAVASDVTCVNGKVRGVLTGLRLARHEAIIIADDDVRYDAESLGAVVDALQRAHIVRPQNYFAPLPWHALWDTGRILLNRVTGGDWPGTLVVRRSALRATGGYSGDVLFENLELVRTIVAAGGREYVAREILVRRIPATASHFLQQRVRQAYDELARPERLLAQLSVLPLAIVAAATGTYAAIGVAAAALVVVAEIGRHVDGGTRVFPARASLFAPAWLVERGVCIWIALGERVLRGGVRYAGQIVRNAATPMRELRRRHAGAITSTSIGLNDPLFDSSAEHAVTPTI